jgi:hypothetical protein
MNSKTQAEDAEDDKAVDVSVPRAAANDGANGEAAATLEDAAAAAAAT